MKFIIIILFNLLFNIINACDCVLPASLKEQVEANELIIKSIVLEHHVKIDDPEINSKMTKIKVIEVIKGNVIDSTLYFVNGSGASCLTSIENYNVKDTLLLMSYYEYFFSLEANNEYKFIITDLCTGAIFQVKHGYVYSWLTKRKLKKRLRKWKKLKKKGDYNATNYYHSHISNPEYKDCYKYEKVKSILNRYVK